MFAPKSLYTAQAGPAFSAAPVFVAAPAEKKIELYSRVRAPAQRRTIVFDASVTLRRVARPAAIRLRVLGRGGIAGSLPLRPGVSSRGPARALTNAHRRRVWARGFALRTVCVSASSSTPPGLHVELDGPRRRGGVGRRARRWAEVG